MPATVKEHYDNHLGEFYAWMAGDFEANQQAFQQFLKKHNILPGAAPAAIDLGAGHGIQSAALAKSGFKVKAIDFNGQLLRQLRKNSRGLDIEVIEDDIRSVDKYIVPKPHVIVCWGDTLTHLSSLPEVEQLLVNCCRALGKNGKLILSFRDYTNELKGDSRFIPVKSDDSRVLTCFLEYNTEHVQVTDLLYERRESGWQQKVSSYNKVRVPVSFVKTCLEQACMQIIFENQVNGLITIIGRKG